ncbi:unnamed protein product [Cyprideis torosa]|uniref:Uncharacterized protein n=1 Tax=Cyprideis torosa TaxID=163714 RepID=A0A7R8W8A0_9CRUS|nr:unnamed protein product [Cyprideis torosa]CAG0884076.1 unnamed protein product [Cyprideis torosa]
MSNRFPFPIAGTYRVFLGDHIYEQFCLGDKQEMRISVPRIDTSLMLKRYDAISVSELIQDAEIPLIFGGIGVLIVRLQMTNVSNLWNVKDVPDVLITRDCLSAFKGRRRDIPADQYEGCRPASKDIQLAQFTFNNIDELDIHRDYYDDVTWCFCDFDERCNSGWGLQPIPFRWLFFLVLLATYCSSHAH